MIWKRMLEAVDFIHSQRVIHSDLKPANFLFVKGELKLIDFGIARSMNSDTTNIQVTRCVCSFGMRCRLLLLPMA
jgi:serine/threonine-protein kinase TTK/MPS1